jgi:Tfp pilus assembly protein PilZ
LSAIFIKSLQIKQANLRAIALASYASFIAKFFKTGSYFEYGTIIFLVLILVSIKQDNKSFVKDSI